MLLRRSCAGAFAALAFSFLFAAQAAFAAQYLVYVGTYTGPKSKGIYAYRFDTATGKLSPLGVAAETQNPSFVALHPNGKYLYAVNEVNDGTVTAYSLDKSSGKLTQLNSVSSKGASPCYVAVEKTGHTALVANYMSGTFASYPVNADGRLGEAAATIQDKGKGPNQARQDAPHAHSINPSPNDQFAIGADLGIDKLQIFKLDAAKSTIAEGSAGTVEPGSGPRHFTFHPNGKFAYAINELKSTVTAFNWDAGKPALTSIQTVSTLPANFQGANTTAEVRVHPSGKFLYGSNRGHNSIAVFSIDSAKGTLTPVEQVSTNGKTPRNFSMDPTGTFLIAANQDSDNLVVFRIDTKTGRLTATGETAEVGSPVCVRFLPLR